MNRGAVPVLALVVVAVAGAFAWLFGPKMLHGDSRRADASQKATAQLVTATDRQAASAAASVAKIGEANALAPESPARDFIAQEVPAALAKLPAPDPAALLDAERRRAAVMEGRADEARRLYEVEAKRASGLQHERDEALASRRAADLALSEAAAEKRGAEGQRTVFALVAGLAVALWLYSRAFSITPATLGAIAADVRAGANPIAAMDTHLAPWLHRHVDAAARLATPPAP